MYSQGEDDGLLVAILRHAEPRTFSYVDIGCGSSGGNSAILAFDFGWRGIMVDMVAENIRRLQAALGARAEYRVETVTPENVNKIVPDEVDVVSIDIDSQDYFVLEALRARPMVLVVEYNASYGPTARVTIDRHTHPHKKSGYYGASLAAMAALAERKGYRLVCCSEQGNNAFFVRSELAAALPSVTVEEAFRVGDARLSTDLLERRDTQLDALLAKIRARGLELVEV